jgi:hypothetical protein
MRGTTRIHGIVAAALLAAACSSSPTEPTSSERSGSGTPEPLLLLQVDPPQATIHAGETVQLTATAESPDGSVVRDIAVTWTSSDDQIASVSSSGLVRGVRPGQAEIDVRWGTSLVVVQITVLKADSGTPDPQ